MVTPCAALTLQMAEGVKTYPVAPDALGAFTKATEPGTSKSGGLEMTVAQLRGYLDAAPPSKFDADPRGPDTPEAKVQDDGRVVRTYTPHPGGGRFIREYGRTSPIAEIRMAEVESPRARAYLDGAYVEKSPQLSPHKWGATTRPMSEQEISRLAGLGRGIPGNPGRVVVQRRAVARPSLGGAAREWVRRVLKSR